MGKMVNHQNLANEMNDLMDHLSNLEPDSDEYTKTVANLKGLYSIAVAEMKLDMLCAQSKQKNETDVKVQTLKNEAEKDKNTKLLIGTITGAVVSGAVAYGIAQQCRADEDQGKPWLSSARSMIPKLK